ncbi:MAG TPA: Mov34/MPN/PAD-1 family protein [Tepidisphaeraceae bacterium]|jgi:proteasome lid subunit RPN8/RPN11
MDVTVPTVPPPDDLDVDRVTPDDGPVRRLDRVMGERGAGFAVVVQRSALNAIHAHGRQDTAVEICGVLVGELRHDRVSPYLLITAHIPGDKATSRETQVTFTAETWNQIQAAMETQYVGKKVVGWYHTHPGFGVFLSGMDLFIQDNFFNLAWQVAWVYDPIAEIDGVFVWRGGKSVQAKFLIEEDGRADGHDFRAALPAVDHPANVAARLTLRERLANVALLTLVFLACFASIWYALKWLSGHGFRVRLPIEL